MLVLVPQVPSLKPASGSIYDLQGSSNVFSSPVEPRFQQLLDNGVTAWQPHDTARILSML